MFCWKKSQDETDWDRRVFKSYSRSLSSLMVGPKAEQSQRLILQTKLHPLVVYEVSCCWAGLREGRSISHCKGLNIDEKGCMTTSNKWWYFGPLLVSLCGPFGRNDLSTGSWTKLRIKQGHWQDILDIEATEKRDMKTRKEQQTGPRRKEWKECIVVNLEGSGTSRSVQMHIAKTGREK